MVFLGSGWMLSCLLLVIVSSVGCRVRRRSSYVLRRRVSLCGLVFFLLL